MGTATGMLETLIICAILSTLAYEVHSDNGHFNGGTISFSIHTDSSGNLLADLDIITGWVLGKGPCGVNCTRSHINVSTIGSRKTAASGTSFGNWTAEYKVYSATTRKAVSRQSNLNQEINSNMTGVVLAINKKAGWEQDMMRVTVQLETPNVYHTEAIYFEGISWRKLTMQATVTEWNIPVRMDTRVRNDTGVQNRSPIVYMKPVYRVGLNQVSTIHIAATDPDGDLVKCEASQVSEGGMVAYEPLKGVTITQDCTITIDTSSSSYGYSDGATGAIAVTVRDYNRYMIMLDASSLLPYQSSLSGTAAQFSIQVQDNIYSPVFVSPTQETNHHFTLYQGATWRQTVYAKASGNTSINYFYAIGRQRENVTLSDIHNGVDKRVKFVDITWVPRDDDVGNHIICIAAVDDTGEDSDENRCYTIEVKPVRFHYSPPTGPIRPHFIDLPAIGSAIECEQNVTCVVPVYVISHTLVDEIKIVTSSFATSEIGPIVKTMLNGTEMYKGDLSFLDSVAGIKKICMKAVDVIGLESQEICVRSNIQPPDPCASLPCTNGAACIRSGQDPAAYECQQPPLIDVCLPSPCKNGGECYTYPEDGNALPLYRPLCYCFPDSDFVGDRCTIEKDKCYPDPCNGHGSCYDGVCSCFDRYSGDHCENDICPREPAGQVTCAAPVCITDPCNSHGLCLPTGACHCSIGYRGNENCTSASGNAAALYKITGTTFVPPSPAPASVIKCYTKQSCTFSVYVATSSVGHLPNITVDRTSETISNSTVSNMAEVRYIPGLEHLYAAEVTVGDSGAKADGTTVLCLKVEAGSFEDKRCYEVLHTENPLKYPETHEFHDKNMTYQFLKPTLNSGTSFICGKDEECTLLIHTNAVGGKCDGVVSGDANVHTLMTHQTGGHCVSEVSSRFQREGRATMCLVASPKASSQTRCYHVDVIDSTTEWRSCQPNPCLHGACHVASMYASCTCNPGYSGKRCDNYSSGQVPLWRVSGLHILLAFLLPWLH